MLTQVHGEKDSSFTLQNRFPWTFVNHSENVFQVSPSLYTTGDKQAAQRF